MPPVFPCCRCQGGFLKRVKLPDRAKADGADSYDYKVDVEVSGGRVKTYEMVNYESEGK